MSGNTGQHITVKMVVGLPVFLCFWTLHILSKSALALISTPVIHSVLGEAMALACFSSGKISEKTVEISPRFCFNICVSIYSREGVKNPTLAGRYMRWELLLIFLTERGLTAMRNRTTLLRAEQSRAEQSRAEQSRAEQSRG